MTLRVNAFAQTINFISKRPCLCCLLLLVAMPLLLPLLHCQCQRRSNTHGLFIIRRWSTLFFCFLVGFAIKTKQNERKKWYFACDGHTRVRLRSIYCFSPLHQINSRTRRPTNQIFNNSVHVCRRWFRFRFVSFSFFCPSLVGALQFQLRLLYYVFSRRFSSLASIGLKCALRT